MVSIFGLNILYRLEANRFSVEQTQISAHCLLPNVQIGWVWINEVLFNLQIFTTLFNNIQKDIEKGKGKDPIIYNRRPLFENPTKIILSLNQSTLFLSFRILPYFPRRSSSKFAKIQAQFIEQYNRNSMKAAPPCIQLSSEDRRVLNLLQLKMYDLSQNVEILGKQLSSNQIKDLVANTYNIFCQLRRIFDNSGTPHLYEIVRKMQVNSVVLISILTERIDKKTTEPVRPQTQERKQQTPKKTQQIQKEQTTERKVNPSKLGGINLYNESYARGLQYFQVTDADSFQQMAGKCRIKQSKKLKQQFMNTISREIELKAQVQMDNVSDEIKKYIKDYKENSKINSYISYEKELVEIIDFFKVSELEAMSFLNKSPNNQDYTEDFINRINDLEHDFKVKEKSEKKTLNQKLKEFIMNLKQRLHDIQLKYQEKATKLALYQKSLKKETNSQNTQTYDGYQFRIKEQEQTIKDLQERYKILSQIKNKQLSFQTQYYEMHHELKIKITEINKIKTSNIQLQEEIDFLKKIIRQNKEKLNVDLKDIERRKNKNRKIMKEPSKKELQQPVSNNANNMNTQQFPQVERRASKLQKKTKRVQRINSRTSTYLKTVELSEIQRQLTNETFHESQGSKQFTETPKKASNSPQGATKQESKQSFFKNEYKKNSKKLSSEERKVSFIEQSTKTQELLIKQESPSNQVTPADLSIENINNEEVSGEVTMRSSRKNVFKAAPDVAGCSIKSLDQNKKSSKSISKKCIIMKENKEKGVLATVIKFQNLAISHEVVNMTIYPEQRYDFNYQKSSSKLLNPSYLRRQRPSYPFANLNSQQLTIPTSSLNQQSNEHLYQMGTKGRSANISMSNKQKLKTLENSEKSSFIDIVKRENYNNFRSKKDINLNINPYSNMHSPNNGQPNASSDVIAPKLQEINYRKLDKINRPKAHLDKHRKDIAAYLDRINSKFRNPSVSENEPGSWRAESLDNSDSNTIADYIIEEITREQLDIEQFKQIAQIIQEDDDRNEPLAEISSGKKVQKGIIPIFKEFQTKKNRKQGVIKEKSHAKKKQNRQPREIDVIKERKIEVFGVGEHVYLKIQDLHKRLSTCSNSDGHPCEHLMKYLTILKKVNEFGSQKCPLKMHIEKIGQQRDTNECWKRSLEDLKSLQRHPQQQKINKSNYVKANMATLDQFIEQQRERILPVISATTSTYYKPKARPLLNNRQ